MGLLDMFSGNDPQNQGLLAAAAQMLQASGPSLMPHSFGQVLGAGYQGYQQGMQGVQDRQLGALKMKALQSDLDQKQALLDMQNRIRQRSLAEISGQPPTAQAAVPGMPVAPPDPAASQPMASAMPGGSMSPKTGGPDWLQSYQASAPAMPTPTATPDSAPSQATSPAQAQPTSLTQSVMARLTRQAQIHAEEGDMDGANKLYEQATKFMPEVNKIEVGQDPTTGKPINVITYKDGRQEVSQFAPKPDIHFADDGQHTAIPINGYTGQAMGSGVARQATPGEILQNRQTAARLAFDKKQASGPDYDPAQVETLAGLVNGGKVAPPTGYALRSPLWSAVLARVGEMNPNFNSQDYGVTTKALKDFGSGKKGDTVRSFNVLLSHLDTLDQLSDQLGNTSSPAYNKLANLYKTQTGSEAPTNLNAVKHIVMDEATKATLGAPGALGDRQAIAQSVNDASSPAQLKGVIRNIKELGIGQLQGLEQQYKTSTGRDDFGRYLSPQAQSLYQSHQSPTPNTPAAAAPTQKSVLKGQVVRGYKFLGGDPSVQSNWEKAQ